jgi:hypothetical protein
LQVEKMVKEATAADSEAAAKNAAKKAMTD